MKKYCNKYLIFTIMYWIFASYILAKMSLGGYFAIGTSDAIAQHYPIMVYISKLLQNMVGSIFNHQQFVFPMVDWTVGMGENTIAALNYYGLGDVFYLLSAFVPEEMMPYFYSFLLYLRIYLGGMVFISLCHEICPNKSAFAYVVGAFAYCFNGFTFASNAHIIFVHAMMYIPLMLLGVERTLKSKRKFVLTLTVFLFSMTGYYYLYVGSIIMAVFAVWRAFELKANIKETVYKFISIVLEYILGLALGAVIFVPATMGLFESDRYNYSHQISLFFSLSDIVDIFKYIHFPFGENILSVMPICIISMIWVVTDRVKKVEKINVILVMLSAIMPFASFVMTGFAAIYDRWELVIILYLAFLVVVEWDDLLRLNIVQRIITVIVLGILYCLGRKFDFDDEQSFQYVVTFYIVITIAVWGGKFFLKNEKSRRICGAIMALIVVAMMCRDWNCVARDMEIDLVREDDVVSELIDDDEGFYRIDYEKVFGEPRYGMNLSLRLGFNGISEYTSVESENYIRAFEKWGASYASINNAGLDQRTILETLAGVKYYIGRSENTMIVPYGFEKQGETSDGEWILYENKYSIPVVYMYNYIFNEDDTKGMSVYDIQELMMQSAVISGYSGDVPTITEWNNDNSEAEYNIIENDGVTIEDGVIHTENGSKIKVTVSFKEGCEYYLTFNQRINVTVKLSDGYEKYKVPITIGNVDKDETQIIEITFGGQYDLTNMQVVQHSFRNYESELNKLTEGVQDYEVETNRVECTVEADKEKILCVAAPMIKGWRAYIDGEETDIMLVNSLYMGISVPKGKHEIVFKYITPGITAGAIISCSALIIVVLYMILLKRKKNK